jgi:hypothetical protein
MAVAPEPAIGGTISIIASVPTTEDASAYEALSWVEIGKVKSLPETVEQAAAGTETLLKTGITQHFNGARMVPPFSIPYVFDADDAGQTIVRSNFNGSTEVSIKIAYADGREDYLQAVLGNLGDDEQTTDSSLGQTIEVRPITLKTRVAAA